MADCFAVTSSIGPGIKDGRAYVRMSFAPHIAAPQGDGWLFGEEAALVMVEEIVRAVLRARDMNRDLRR